MRGLCRIVLFACVLGSFGCKEERTITVRRFTFKGVASVDVSALKATLVTRESSRLPWGRKRAFDRSRFDDDLKRIQAFYADHGYPDARVASVDIVFNKDRGAVDVTVMVSEGEPVRVAALEFSGFNGLPPRAFETLKRNIPVQIGQARDRQQVLLARDLALTAFRDHGYPSAIVTVVEREGTTAKSVTLCFTANAGPVAYFGPVEVAGNASVSDTVVRRELAYHPGDLYELSRIRETQRRLYAMEVFQFVNVESVVSGDETAVVPTRITVAEGKHHRLNFGVGYGTDERERVDAEYRLLNFLGGARSLDVHTRWSSLDRGVRVAVRQPYFVHPAVTLDAEGQQWYTYVPAYSSIVSGGKLTMTHHVTRTTSWSLVFTNEHDQSSIASSALNNLTLRNSLIALGLDPRSQEQSGILTALGLDAQRSTTDDLLNPRRGYQLAIHAEQAGRLLPGTYHYDALAGDARLYAPLADRVVLATRGQIGGIVPAEGIEGNIPFSRKYLLGGATSLRGWGTYEVSPLAGGLPIGGDAMLAFSSELRVSFRGSFGAVAFVDAGNVWTRPSAIDLRDLRYDIGPGLRYQTPLGPLRFDFGYQLNPEAALVVNGEPQARHWRIHFSIGQAF